MLPLVFIQELEGFIPEMIILSGQNQIYETPEGS